MDMFHLLMKIVNHQVNQHVIELIYLGSGCCDSTCHFMSASTVCRASQGACDITEYCTGSNAACPNDAKQLASFQCRPSIDLNGNCDPTEYCDGKTNACPTDVVVPNNTACTSTDTCLGNTTCKAGICTGTDIYCKGICGDGIKATTEQWYATNLM